MERPGTIRFRLAKAKRTSLLVITFVLLVTLLASCSGGTNQGNEGSSKEESTSASKDRNEGEDKGSSKDAGKEVASIPGSANQNERGGKGSNDKGATPNYPDPPPPAIALMPAVAEERYHPDVDSDGVGSTLGDVYPEGRQPPPGWVIYNSVHWDNCPETYNPNQEDSDGDGWGDFCDPEPFKPYDPTQGR